MRCTLSIALALALSACSTPSRLAVERAAVDAEQARYDSLRAVPEVALTLDARTARDSLAARETARQAAREEIRRRDTHYRGNAAVAFAIGALVLCNAVASISIATWRW